MKKNIIDVSNNLLVQPWENGVKLIKPDIRREEFSGIETASLNNVGEILKLPFNIYFLDKNSAIQNLNETAINNCGFPSIKNTLGNTCHVTARRETAEQTIRDDVRVIKNNQANIFEEHFIRLDEITFPAVSFKFPWYNHDNAIIGIFAFCIALRQNNLNYLTNGIAHIIKLGLLTTRGNIKNPFMILPGKQIDGVYLSQRESQCLYLLAKGKTAKMIAKILSLSPRTVEHYVENIKVKLNVRSKSELIDKFITKGIANTKY